MTTIPSHEHLSHHVVTPVAEANSEPPLIVRDERLVFQENGGAGFTVTAVDAVTRDTHTPLIFHIASIKKGHPGAVCVAVHHSSQEHEESSDCHILLARHWRMATNEWAWEFPRGMGEADESAEQTAVRELSEETGIHADESQVHILQTIHADTGVLRDNIAIAHIALSAEMPMEDHDWELADLQWLSPEDITTLIATGQITDGITLAAFSVVQAQGTLQHLVVDNE